MQRFCRHFTRLSSANLMSFSLHTRARLDHPAYTKFDVYKFSVPDDKCPWSVEWPEYAPVEFTHPRILEQPVYADPVNPADIDWDSKRFSMEYKRQGRDKYDFDENGRPVNPIGRTGMRGRGRMGKWGPNMAADCLVTRIAPDAPVLEFVAIQRSDTGIWAMPGGMVDGLQESFKTAAVREFFEEAAVGNEHEAQLIQAFEANVVETYAGYVDDNRATDNTWTETAVYWMHYSSEEHPAMQLQSGDDAVDARWMRLDEETFTDKVTFHGHHRQMILDALRQHDAFAASVGSQE